MKRELKRWKEGLAPCTVCGTSTAWEWCIQLMANQVVGRGQTEFRYPFCRNCDLVLHAAERLAEELEPTLLKMMELALAEESPVYEWETWKSSEPANQDSSASGPALINLILSAAKVARTIYRDFQKGSQQNKEESPETSSYRTSLLHQLQVALGHSSAISTEHRERVLEVVAEGVTK